jgi:type VI protein secretion system component VasK
VKLTREQEARPSPPPPLEANDQVVTGVLTAGWAIALVVLLIVRGSLPPGERWWIWTCACGLVMGLFGWWYVPRLKRGRAQAAARAAAENEPGNEPGNEQSQSAPRDNGSNTVSSTETPGSSTRS